MVVDRFNTFQLTDRLWEYSIVNSFNNLGSTISNNGNYEAEFRRRNGMAKNTMSRQLKFEKIELPHKKIKMRLHALVFSIFLYRAETWTLCAQECIKLIPSRCGVGKEWFWYLGLVIEQTFPFLTNSVLKKDLVQHIYSVVFSCVVMWFAEVTII